MRPLPLRILDATVRQNRAMQKDNYMQSMAASSALFGSNDLFIEGLYEDYLADPASVPAAWRAYFDDLQAAPGGGHDVAHSPIQRAFAAIPARGALPAAAAAPDRKQVAVLQLINAYRFLGVRIAS